jgi:hypothetical protein
MIEAFRFFAWERFSAISILVLGNRLEANVPQFLFILSYHGPCLCPPARAISSLRDVTVTTAIDASLYSIGVTFAAAMRWERSRSSFLPTSQLVDSPVLALKNENTSRP